MKTISLLILSILLMAGTAQARQATGSITGTVTSSASDEPVIGANIGIAALGMGSATDSTGLYAISDLPPGKLNLQVSAIGFQRRIIEVNVLPGQATELNIVLKPSIHELEEMVVTGTMRQTHVKDSPVKVSVVKASQLQQGRTSSNIMDLINSVNGLSTQLNCAVCGTNAIRINGVEGANTAVLIDGMPIMGALASVYGLNGISPSIIDQVEVIKGPQSTLYGTQALGGVVNIITKNPSLTPTLSADVYTEDTRESSLNIAYSPASDRFEGFISGNVLRLEHFMDENGDQFNDLVKQSRVSLFAKGTLFGDNKEQRLNIAAKFLSEDRTGGLQNFRDDMRGSDQIYGESIFTNRFEFMSDYMPAGFGDRLRFSGAVTYHDQDSYYGTDWYDATQSISFGQATWDQPIGKNVRMLSGATVRYETYDDNTPATADGTDHRWIPGIFSQGEFSTGKFTFLAGLRLDHHSEHGVVTAPRLSSKFSPTDLTTIRLSAGTGFRVVNIFTEDHAALTGSREVVFSEDLDPERSQSITGSIEQIISFGANPMTLSLDGFYTYFSNKIIPDYDSDPNLILYQNLNGFSVTRGVSAGLEQNFTRIPLSYSASFTLMDVFTEQDNTREPLEYAPEYTGTVGATYRVNSLDMELGYNGNLIGPKKMPQSYAENFGREPWSPAHSTHDFKMTVELSNVNSASGVGIEAFVSAENVFNFRQDSPLVDPGNPFGPDFDTIYTWGPIIGRTVSIGARLNIR